MKPLGIIDTIPPDIIDIRNIVSPADGEPAVSVGIDYQTGSIVTGSVFEAIQGQNQELVFEGDGIQ